MTRQCIPADCLRGSAVSVITGLSERRLQELVSRGVIIPAVPGRRGRGNTSWYSMAQVAALKEYQTAKAAYREALKRLGNA